MLIYEIDFDLIKLLIKFFLFPKFLFWDSCKKYVGLPLLTNISN